MELMRLENVSKVYEDAEGSVLKSTDLIVESGDYLSIKGVSGSGKSTLLFLLGGLLSPTTGTVLFQGQDIYSLSDDALSAWRGKYVGYLFQNIHIAQALTVRENMMLARTFGNDGEADIDAMLHALGLSESADKLPGRLSGGQKRRAMIGCVLIRKPQIILADEPTNDLDAEWAARIMALLQEQIQSGRTLILVTHDPRWADTAPVRYSISNGRLTREQ